MKSIIITLAITACLSSCTYAARQVLGEKATPINPTKGQRLEVAKVFRVKKDGTTYQICKPDLNNRAIRAIVVEKTEDSSESVSDKISGENVTFTLPGIPTLRVPYRKTQVSGYTITKASWPSDDDFYSYVRKSVGKNCRDLIRQGNVLIVESEARAKKSSQAYKGPISDFQIGSLKVEKLGDEYVVRAPNNVTFGIIAASP